MCFADDLLMFCKAEKTSISLMQETFQKFSQSSGLQANADKSSIYIAGLNQRDKEDIAHMLGFNMGNLPFRYLGVPLSTKKLTIAQCLPLVENITQRVRCWSARMLSYAGRLQLIKSVVFGMQSYWAQIFVLPKKIIKLVEAVCRSFLWTGTGEISRKALVAWERVCQPGSAGGLNVINLQLWNKAEY